MNNTLLSTIATIDAPDLGAPSNSAYSADLGHSLWRPCSNVMELNRDFGSGTYGYLAQTSGHAVSGRSSAPESVFIAPTAAAKRGSPPRKLPT